MWIQGTGKRLWICAPPYIALKRMWKSGMECGMNHGHTLPMAGGCRRLPGVRSSVSARIYRCRRAYCYSSCSRYPILVGCPAEPCSWRLYLGTLCITKNLSYMRALRRRVGDGLWYSSGVYSTYTRDGARSSHRDIDLRAFPCRHQHVAKAGDGRSCPFGEFIW